MEDRPRPRFRPGLAAAGAAGLALALTTRILDPLRHGPWAFVLLAWFAAFVFLAGAIRTPPLRMGAVVFAAVLLGLSGFERWLSFEAPPPWAADAADAPEVSPFYVRPDAVTGFAPARSWTAHAVRRHAGRVIFDVRYGIGADGFRVTPAPVVEPPDGTVIVFGCSFAFGEGVRDEDTFPWRLAERAGRRWTVRNLAFSGWGPNQMLALLESSRALGGEAAGAGPVVVVYEAIADHVMRALGRRPWSRGTPRYVAGPGGTILRRGSFDDAPADGPAALRASLSDGLERWITWRRVFGSERRVKAADVAFVASLVARARELVLRADPSARFEILYWDEHDELSESYRQALRARGFRIHDVSGILPGYPDDRRGLQLPFDGHPTPLANDRLAAYAARLLPEPGPGR